MQELPYFKAFPSDWEQAMRRADIPPEDRGEVYRLIFFAWADGGLNWDDEVFMRRYAREMGWQWRRFLRTLEHYKRLCSPESEYRLPVFLLRNFKQSLPEVSPKFHPSFTQVSAKFEPSLSQVLPEFDLQTASKSFNGVAAENTCHSHSQKPEAEAGAPTDNFHDPLADMALAIVVSLGESSVPVGDGAAPIHEAAGVFVGAGIQPAEVGEYERDYYKRKAAQGNRYPLTLRILREDLPSFVRAKRQRQAAALNAAEQGKSPARLPVIVAPAGWSATQRKEGAE